MPTPLIIFGLLLSIVGATAPRIATSNPRDPQAGSPRGVAESTTSLETRTIERVVHLSAPNTGASRYAYVPFDVPPGAVRINVSYQYDRAHGANTIDIGLFDARSSGSDTDRRGFRGWSGGSRSEFFVSPREATPGYLAGEMPAGTWHIILGLYRVAPSGVDVGFKISITTDDNGPGSIVSRGPKTGSSAIVNPSNARPGSSSIALRQGLRWWSGDLHMHTIYSDGDWTIEGLLSSARSLGLDFICITDHNTSSHHLEIDRLSKDSPKPLLLRGEEITTYGGHANAWGLPSGTWIDFRVSSKDNAGISNIAAEAHRSGALISINHPFALCGGCAWSYDAAARGFDAIEVWNGEWDWTDEQALKMWDKILQSGRHITAIGSSDSHRAANPIGHPTAHVAARVESQRALLDAIRQGRVYLTSEVARPVLRFEAETMGKRPTRWMVGDEFHFSTPATIRFLVSAQAAPPGSTISLVSNGQVLRSLSTTTDGRPQIIEVECRSDSYYRLEVRDGVKAMLALTNPIYVKIESR